MSDILDPDPFEPYHQLFSQVGYALSGWSQVETALSLLFNVISHIPDHRRAGAAFDAIVAFEARVAVCNALIQLEPLHEVEHKMWNALYNRIKKYYRKRHELAHFSVFTGEAYSPKPTIKPFFTWQKHVRNEVITLDFKQINERANKFSEINFAVMWFDTLVRERRGLPILPALSSSAEPPLIQRLRATAIQTLQARDTPPQPSEA